MRRLLLTCALGLLPGCDDPDYAPELTVLGVEISDDFNEDGWLSAGESATLTVHAGNRGLGNADRNTECTPRTMAAGVEVRGSLRFNACRSRTVCDSSFEVTVPPGLDGETLDFECTPGDGTPAFTFAVPLVAPDVRLELAHLAWVNDPSEDGVLNPGETATLEVGFRNVGASALSRSRCVVGAISGRARVSASDDTLSFNTCASGSLCGVSTIQIDASEARADEGLTFGCDLVDSQARVWPQTFSLRVEPLAAQPAVDLVSVFEDADRDGLLSADETARLRVALQNVGPSTLTRASCTVTGDDVIEVLSSDDTLNYNRCDADDDCGTSDIRVRGLRTGTGTLICPLENSQGTRWMLEFPVEVR